MADEEHIALLKQGVEAWNAWRKVNPDIKVDLGSTHLGYMNLSGVNLNRADLNRADLNRADLNRADLNRADLNGADLNRAKLRNADLNGAELRSVDLRNAYLGGADLRSADLRSANLNGAALLDANLGGANLGGVNLRDANLRGANLNGAALLDADLSGAFLRETVFGNTDLTRAKGLETCRHMGPSTIDHRTLQRSGPLPLVFLRGVGLPDNLIDYLPSLLNQPIQFFSCFISYSSKDQKFADRLHADLQNKGVRCWFAPHDLPIGAKIIDAIDEAIRLRDKVLLILSEHSVASDWVEEEVTRALAEEQSRKTTVLFPIRVDDAVLNTDEAWARGLRIQRHIGDFCLWKDHDAYQKALERVLRDLKVAQAEP